MTNMHQISIFFYIFKGSLSVTDSDRNITCMSRDNDVIGRDCFLSKPDIASEHDTRRGRELLNL